MSLEDFKQEDSTSYKRYGSHEYDEKLEKLANKFDSRFPVNLEIDFIEVSPSMEKHAAITYKRDGKHYYIRFSESYLENSTEEEIKRTLLHEMVHVYLYQRGYSNHSHGRVFRWVLGRVGGSFTGESIHSDRWEHCIKPFLDEEGE